jgi:hypothetical protein
LEPALQDSIDDAVLATRMLVEIEFIGHENTMAQAHLDKGDADAAANKPASAIGDYKAAWKALIK